MTPPIRFEGMLRPSTEQDGPRLMDGEINPPRPEEYPILSWFRDNVFLPLVPNFSLDDIAPRQGGPIHLYRRHLHADYPIHAGRLEYFLPEVVLNSQPTLREILRQFANNFFAVDLDLINMPINRGSTLRRFSEWASRAHGPRQPNLDVQAGTLARGHGEIRPIRGTGQSWITRVNVDPTPNFIYVLPGAVPNLEIDEFAAIDPPLLTYDWERLPQSPVTHMQAGDLDYENPTQTGGRATTPFGSLRDPPRGNHNYWMFHFNPVFSTLAASIEEFVAEGHLQDIGFNLGIGALNLWAFLPTYGLGEEFRYEELGIPYNTFPRRFGDLIHLLYPLFTEERNRLREEGLLMNPNTDYNAQHYMDAQGRPQVIPDDPETTYRPHYEVRHFIDPEGQAQLIPQSEAALASLNRERQALGLESLQRGIWREIPEDPEALSEINGHLRSLSLGLLSRARRRRLPENPEEVRRLNGQIRRLNDRDDLELRLLPRSRGGVADWIGLDLSRDPERLAATAEDQMPHGSFRAQMRDLFLRLPLGHVQINHETQFTIRYRLERDINEASGEVSPRYALSIEFHPLDLGTLNLRLNESSHLRTEALRADSIEVRIPDVAQLFRTLSNEEISLSERLASLGAEINLRGVQVHGLRLGSEAMELLLEEGHIDRLSLRGDGEHLRMALRGIRAQGLRFQGEAMGVGLDTGHHAQDLFIRFDPDGTVRSRMVLGGGIEQGHLDHPTMGRMYFTTLADGENTPEDQGGEIRVVANPFDPELPFNISWQLPYLGIWTSMGTRLRMERGASHLRDSRLQVSREGVELEGDVDLHASLPRGLANEPLQLFEESTSIDTRIQDLEATGRVRIHFSPHGFRLEGTSESNPLNINFHLRDTQLQHRPRNLPPLIARLASSEIIQTQVEIDSARVRLENIRQAEVGEVEVDGETRTRLRTLEAGPVTIQDVQGSGSIWVNLLIWGFVRGFFPILGAGGGATTSRSGDLPAPPDASLLTHHLPEAVRQDLGSGDFLRIGGVSVQGHQAQEWEFHLEDIILNLHEGGGRGQFGLMRIPNFFLERRGGHIHPHYDPNSMVNVFLNEPDRGGSFRFVRWSQP